ncbi:putative Na/K ATPase alpha 1 subunit [Kickxella alabastrina]|uniref:putative Na/K ATPase alpha 1 subunit n=1 Tax=Kickxella alabastrina TaxID=61397 RepID=UPI0022201488|nr:putative Na/K ATPase alpha 1 subunit [Kickxella alabastrina]KAI7827732.1 putative Na/K ATPase alpha 1 subunit [Kickxella alabastrina]KAJ1946749.1 hypothetical protein GGF37_000961 [Kickxella alabastrina]
MVTPSTRYPKQQPPIPDGPVLNFRDARISRNTLPLAAEFRTLSIQISENENRRSQRLRGLQSFLRSPRWQELLSELVPMGSAHRQQEKHEQQRNMAMAKIAQQLRDYQFHRDTVNEVFTRMGTSPVRGLEPEAIERRRSQNGRNVVGVQSRMYLLRIFSWFFGGFNRFLWLSVIVFWLCWKPIGNPPQTGNLALGIVIIVIIFMQALFSAWQEWITSRALNSITSMVPEATVVLREGRQMAVAPADLVPGDIVVLRAGDCVPADVRLVEASPDLMLDRSVLTGAPDPTIGTVEFTNANYLETRNMAMMGGAVTQGVCTGIVVAIGDRTVFGRLSRLTQRQHIKPKRTILQLEVRRLVNGLTTLSLVVAAFFIILWAAWLRTSYPGFMSVSDALANGVGVLVTFVPGSLPISLTLALTAIAKRMQRHNVLIKNLTTVETLGSVNAICCEKTGTLTQRKMAVTCVAFADIEMHAAQLHRETGIAARRLYETAAWCNGATLNPDAADLPESEREVFGDATDSAFLRLATQIKGFVPAAAHKTLLTIPFHLRNRWMLTVCSTSEPEAASEPFILIKGAPETLLPHCSEIQSATGEILPMDVAMKERIKSTQQRWATEGCRVLLLCRREFSSIDSNPFVGIENSPAHLYSVASDSITQLCVVGLVGMVDPPRAEIPGVVDTFRRAGIRVFMVTGDYSHTAAHVARQCRIITGIQVDGIDDVLDITARASAKEKADEKPNKKVSGIALALDMLSDNSLSRQESLVDSQYTLSTKRSLVVSGPELVGLRPECWDTIATYEEIVFARITPEQKLQIVEELRERDNYVAVTGDDVNDLPAMRAAHVGVAMGNGSEVAKAAADIVLLDNNFSSIVVAIECGRLVFVNLKKVIIYLLPMTNLSEIVPSFLNVVLGLPIPLSTFLMLVINTITDMWASIVLINEEPETDIMLNPPRNPKKEGLVNVRFFLQAYGFIGIIQTLSGHIIFFLCIYMRGNITPNNVFLAFSKWTDGYLGRSKEELAHIVSIAGSSHFMAMVVMQWGNMFVARTRTLSVFQQNPFWGPKSNPLLLVAIPISILVALFFNEVSWFNEVFLTGKIPVEFYFIPIPFAFALISLEEVRKLIVRNYPKSLIARLAW